MPYTDKGFERLTYEECLSIWTERAKVMFGEDIDTSNQSMIGKFLRLFCQGAAENEEQAEKAFFVGFPNTAEGVWLDRLSPLVGISRNPATYAWHEIVLKGTAGETVEMGFLVSDGNVVFHTIKPYTIGTDGSVVATVECNDSGAVGNVAIGTINTIVNPSAVVSGVEHINILQSGEEIESDYSLRRRFTPAMSNRGSGTIEAIKAAVLSVSGVESVLIVENSTSIPSEIPAHSFQTYVLAPTAAQQEIAEAIFEKKPIGVTAYGSETVQVKDSGGGIHDIGFSWTERVYIHVKCTVSTDDNFSNESIQQIKEGIVDKLLNHENGQDVTVTSLYSAIYVNGVTDVPALSISKDGSAFGMDTIAINPNEVARAIEANIEVVVS
jgi:uncharacterized phage protein gp47/JayE